MRLELAGTLIVPDPLVIQFVANQDFDAEHYIDLGYTHFDVICIGAGGGRGGGINTVNTGTLVRNFGGAGGGGGFHRIRGLLSAIPSSCPIVVGAAGAVGTEHISNPANTTDGADGGGSSFNTDTCRASGGKGGKRAQSNSLTVTTDADGGEGGIGDRINAGGGALGGIAGTPTDPGLGTPGIDGEDGDLFLDIGKGGGGGAGGVGKFGPPAEGGTTCNAATSGGRGSYNPADTSVYGPGDSPSHDGSSQTNSSNSDFIIPGNAGGARASALNGLPTMYGKSGDPGIVVVRLTTR